MLFLTLTAILLLASPATVVIGDFGGTMIILVAGLHDGARREDPEVGRGSAAFLRMYDA